MADRRTPQTEGAGHLDAKSNETGKSASTMRRVAAATELEDMGAMTYARQSGTETPSVATAKGKEICWYCNSGRSRRHILTGKVAKSTSGEPQDWR